MLLGSPLGRFASFLLFLYIPEKESYLAKWYANEWPEYEAKTVKLLFPYCRSRMQHAVCAELEIGKHA
jgi:hypothetical protein